MGVPDKLSRVRLLWDLFDDGSPLGKAILGKLTDVIDLYIEGKGLPSHSAINKDEEDLAEVVWRAVKGTLESMVVARVKIKDVDEIKKTLRHSREIDLVFLSRMHLLFQDVRKVDEEAEVVYVVIRRLVVKWQDKILEVYLVNTLNFVNLIDLFKTKEKQEEYKGLAGLRLGTSQKAASTSQIPQGICHHSLNSKAYGRKVENKPRCSIRNN